MCTCLDNEIYIDFDHINVPFQVVGKRKYIERYFDKQLNKFLMSLPHMRSFWRIKL